MTVPNWPDPSGFDLGTEMGEYLESVAGTIADTAVEMVKGWTGGTDEPIDVMQLMAHLDGELDLFHPPGVSTPSHGWELLWVTLGMLAHHPELIVVLGGTPFSVALRKPSKLRVVPARDGDDR